MSETADSTTSGSMPAPRTPGPRRMSWAWVGVLPFFIFVMAFLLLPSATIFVGSFQNPQGQFTMDNLAGLLRPNIRRAYALSIQISAATALGGGLFGFLLAYAVTICGLSP